MLILARRFAAKDGSMASTDLAEHHDKTITENGSDYGSDIDETALNDILVQAESPKPPKQVVVQSIEQSVSQDATQNRRQSVRLSRIRQPVIKTFIDEQGVTFEAEVYEGPIREPSVEVEYDESNRTAFSREFC